MADYTDEFLKLYRQIAHQLSLSDILSHIKDIRKFCFQLKTFECITDNELSAVLISSDKNALRGTVLFRILILKEDTDWHSGFLEAIKATSPSTADYAVVTILEVYNEILDKVLHRENLEPIDWGPHTNRTFGDDSVDRIILKMAYQLALPDLIRNITTKRLFCQNLCHKRILTESDLDNMVLACDEQMVNLLKDEDAEVVFSALPHQFLNANSRIARNEARSYVIHKIMHHKPQKSVWKKAAIFGGLALTTIGVGVAGVFLAPIAIAGLGFGAGGIVAGSAAATFMASYGGTVAAGSLCALLQSAGAVGLGAGASVGIGAGAGGTFLGSFAIVSKVAVLVKKFRHSNVSRLFKG